MNSEVNVSVIIPCFNGSNYITALSKCLIECVGTGTEVIFVDDGSTDNSGELFRKYYPQGIILEKKNAGLAAARNSGAKIAKGKYLQFLDADDAIKKNKIESQFFFAESNNLDIVYSDWQMVVVKTDKIIFESVLVSPMKENPLIELIQGWWAPFHSYLIKKSAYFEVGKSDEGLVNAQDFDVLLRTALHKKTFGYVSGNYSQYFRYENTKSLARSSKVQYFRDYEKTVLNCYYFLLNTDQINKKLLDSICNRLFTISRNIYAIDEIWANALFYRILQINPKFKVAHKPSYNLLFRFFGFYFTERIIKISKKIISPTFI